MDNLQFFPNLVKNTTVRTMDLVSDNLFTSVKIVVTWGKLLGTSNDEILKMALANNNHLKNYVVNTKADFIKNYKNSHKFPKMNNSDWK